MHRVVPSGTASAHARVPMLRPPPGRFSTTNGWPSAFCKPSASARVKMSPPPPGASGMMIRTGRNGQSCAAAGAGVASPSAAAINASWMPRDVMSLRLLAGFADDALGDFALAHDEGGELLRRADRGHD